MHYDPYRDHMREAVLSADPIELVVMLYTGLRDSILRARRCLQQGDIRGRSDAVSNGLEILAELSATLDRDKGGELATNLAALYSFAAAKLQDGNFQQIDAPLADAERVIVTLLEAWNDLRPSASLSSLQAATHAYDLPVVAPSLSFCG